MKVHSKTADRKQNRYRIQKLINDTVILVRYKASQPQVDELKSPFCSLLTFKKMDPENLAVKLPSDNFFRDAYPMTLPEYEANVKRLETARDAWHAAREALPDGAVPTIKVLARWPDSRDLSKLQPEELKDRRAIPEIARNPAYKKALADKIEIVLGTPLQSGDKKWSQVWKARVNVPGAVGSDVVIKIFQESLFRRPDEYGVPGDEVEDYGWWPSGARIARTEAWAFNVKLKNLQG